MQDTVPGRDADALEQLNSNKILEDYVVYAEPREDAYNSLWFGVAIALLGASTLIAAAAIAYVEASV